MHFDTAYVGWVLAGVSLTYTILRNLRLDGKAAREKRALAEAAVVTRVGTCEGRIDQIERELGQLVDIVRKSADLNMLVAGLARDVKGLETGLTEVKTMYRDLNRTLNDYFRPQQQPR